MAINQEQITPDNGAARKDATIHPAPGQTVTAGRLLLRQLATRVKFLAASIYARTYTATLAVSVGYVPVGRSVAAVTLEIAATTDRFKIGAAIIGLSGTRDSNTGLPTIVHKAISDNIEFSSAYTVNAAAASGQFWGAFRIQMNASGTVSTRAASADQVFTTEADALSACPAAAANMVDLGTITIRSATGAAFTCNTTALNAAGTTVNYNGKATGFTLITTAAIAPVAATLVQGTMEDDETITTPNVGCLLVVLYTSDGSMVVTDPSVNISYRPYPLNSES